MDFVDLVDWLHAEISPEAWKQEVEQTLAACEEWLAEEDDV